MYNQNIKAMRRYFILIIAVVLAGLTWQCSRNSGMDSEFKLNTNLKSSLQTSADKVNNALTQIAETPGYQLLSAQTGLKSGESYTDSITMDLVKGVYEYMPDSTQPTCFNCASRLFKKTGISDNFVVKLPQKLIFHPHYLHYYNPANNKLANNFIITANDYHFYYTSGMLYDYKLSAGFELDSSNIGSLYILSSLNTSSGLDFSSKYSFENGYYISVSSQSGDTTSNMIALSSDTGTLFKETASFTGDHHWGMHHADYTLTIGNVEIHRLASSDSIQVYLNGVLQQKATVQFIDSSDSTTDEHSVCSDRDIQITFDDSTSVKLSTLIQPSLTVLKSVIGNMRNMYFATDIVDYIAYNIYRNRIQ